MALVLLFSSPFFARGSPFDFVILNCELAGDQDLQYSLLFLRDAALGAAVGVEPRRAAPPLVCASIAGLSTAAAVKQLPGRSPHPQSGGESGGR